MTVLTPGANMPLNGDGPYTVHVSHRTGPDVDLTAFLLQANSKVRDDGDMVFYNQNERINDGAEWRQPTNNGGVTTHTLVVSPAKWPSTIERVRIALTVDNNTFGNVDDLQAELVDASGVTIANFDLSKRGPENAFIVGEIYRRNGQLKVRCESAGFSNGLAGLGTHAGVVIEDEPAPSPQSTAPAPISLVKRLAETPPPANAPTVDLRKHKLAVVLVKNNLDAKVFRIVLLIDASGSMYHLFADRGSHATQGGGLFGRKKTTSQPTGGLPSVVQCSFERMVPVADLLDDNHEMEVWFFGTRPKRSESVTVDTMEGYIQRNWKDKEAAGWDNVEPLVMQEVIDWVKQNPSPYPTVVLAWSDGGVGNARAIERKLIDSSSMPIFWMWLGLGTGANYGILERLDNIEGGVVDNCGFFAIDDIERMSDEDLYGKIFAFVSKWHREATAAGVITSH